MGFLFLLLGAGIIGWGVFSYFRKKNWVKTEGFLINVDETYDVSHTTNSNNRSTRRNTVNDFSIRVNGNDSIRVQKKFKKTISYNVNGSEFIYQDKSYSTSKPNANGRYDIYFDPNDPSKSMVGSPLMDMIALSVIGAILVVLAFVQIF